MPEEDLDPKNEPCEPTIAVHNLRQKQWLFIVMCSSGALEMDTHELRKINF